MGFYGRHKLFAILWTWSRGPIPITVDIEGASGSKSCSSTSNFSFVLFPRKVPSTTSMSRRSVDGWMEILAPNDWVFVFVDPQDGSQPECLAMGFIDRVDYSSNVASDGSVNTRVNVRCSGWEKAMLAITALSDPWLGRAISQINLYEIALRGTSLASETSDMPATRDAYNPKTTVLIANLVEVFLRAEEREATLAAMDSTAAALGLTPSEAGRSTAALIEAEQEIDDVGAVQLDPVVSDSSTSAPEAPESVHIYPLMGQFLLPQSTTPLWQLLKMKFENVNEYCATTPHSIANMLGTPLARMIDQWSNQLINLLFYDVRRISSDGLRHISGRVEDGIVGGYSQGAFQDVIDMAGRVSTAVGSLFSDVAPYMILMKRPLFAEELLELEGPVLNEKDCVRVNLGYSDADLHNLTVIEASWLRRNQSRSCTELRGIDVDPRGSISSIQRHGLRLYEDQVSSWPPTALTDAASDPGAISIIPPNNPAVLLPWNFRIQRAGLDAVRILNGSVTIPKYVRGLYLGGKLILNHKETPRVMAPHSRVYFVDGIDWDYEAASGKFSYDIALTRGYEIGPLAAEIASL